MKARSRQLLVSGILFECAEANETERRVDEAVCVSRRERLSEEPVTAEPPGPEYVVKNRLQLADAAVHGWYRFVLGYPPHLVREYLQTLEADPIRDWVFDPFCGTATTPVEARLQGFTTLSIDANPISILAARVKLEWDIDLDEVQSRLDDVLNLAVACLRRVRLDSMAETNYQLTLFGPSSLSERNG